MKNQFIHELNLDLDIIQLKEIALNATSIEGIPSHHRLVSSSEYLASIKNKFSFLSPVFNVYKFVPGRILNTHIDADRHCAINIPICCVNESHTIFYEKDESAILEYDPTRIVYNVNSLTKEAFRFTLKQPTLINTTFPHSVINYGNDTRVIISWSVLKPITFESCSDLMSML